LNKTDIKEYLRKRSMKTAMSNQGRVPGGSLPARHPVHRDGFSPITTPFPISLLPPIPCRTFPLTFFPVPVVLCRRLRRTTDIICKKEALIKTSNKKQEVNPWLTMQSK